MIQKIEKFLQDLITGKIPTTLNLNEPDSFEDGETFKEDINIKLLDDCSIHCEFEWSYSREKGQKGDGYLTPDDPDTLTLNWLNITDFSYYETEIMTLDLGPMFEEPKLKGLMLQFLSNEIIETYCDEMDKSIYQEIKSLKEKKETTIMTQTKESRLMKFEQFINESKMFIKHFRPEDYNREIKNLSEWKTQPNHFYTTNDKGTHLEIILYVKGKPTEKFIFDGDKSSSNESRTITAHQMVHSFIENVDAGWILKSILIDRESISNQLVEHFDVTYGIGNLEEEYPREFQRAVSKLCKIYLK